MGKRVFLSGPIHKMERKQSYRDKLRRILLRYGYEPIDPWQREKVIYIETYSMAHQGWWNKVPSTGFIKRDLEDIDRCDILVAYMPKLSAGTCMELFYAKMKRKKTVVISSIENPSPWIVAHADVILKDIKELEDFLKRGI